MSVAVHQAEELKSDHEEADTRMFLHAKHASERSHDVIIQSADMDVFCLCLAFSHTFRSGLFMAIGERMLDTKKAHARFGSDLCEAVCGLHAFTGCDSVSCFRGKGKIKPLVLMQESQEFTRAFQELGESWEISDSTFASLESFVCKLYGQQTCASVNDARYNHFKATCRLDKGTPPNEDCLKQHVARANYQAAIWRRAATGTMAAPDPTTYGWKVVDNQLVINWMVNSPVPEPSKPNSHGVAARRTCVCQPDAHAAQMV